MTTIHQKQSGKKTVFKFKKNFSQSNEDTTTTNTTTTLASMFPSCSCPTGLK